jgi:hypothetical protein
MQPLLTPIADPHAGCLVELCHLSDEIQVRVGGLAETLVRAFSACVILLTANV